MSAVQDLRRAAIGNRSIAESAHMHGATAIINRQGEIIACLIQAADMLAGEIHDDRALAVWRALREDIMEETGELLAEAV